MVNSKLKSQTSNFKPRRAPRVSVVMAAYNAREYLREAIESVLNQTFKDFEFIIIDDGSTDDTVEIIRSYRDPRIVLHERSHQGLIATLNYGIKIARGEYIARMDTDDVSEPRRFELQVKFLDSHPDHAVVGTTTQIIDTKGRTIDISAEPLRHEEIVQGLLVRNVLAHGSVMMREDAVRKVGGYDPEAIHAEDYDLWVRISREGKLANLPQPLFKWRLNPQGISVTKSKIQRQTVERIKDRQWHNLPRHGSSLQLSFRNIWMKRLQPDLTDPFWRRRRGALAVIYSRLGRELLLRGRRWKAVRYVLTAWVLSPRWVPNYLYVLALLFPRSFLIPAENFFRPIKWSLSQVWHSVRLVSFVELPKGGILFVRRGIYPGFDFPEAHQFAEELARLGKSVGVVCLKSGNDPSYEVVNGVKVFRLAPNTNFFRWIFQFLLLFNLWGRSFDVVHVFWGKGFLLLPIFARRSAKRWVLDVRSGHIGGFFSSVINNGLVVADSYFFDHVITLDERLLRKLWRKSPKPRDLHFVPMGVNEQIFRPQSSKDLAQKIGVGKDDFVLVYQGTLDKSRRLDLFLQGFAGAVRQIPRLKLLIVGDGSNRGWLEEEVRRLGIAGRVIFVGRVPYQEVSAYISVGNAGVSYVPQTKPFLNQQVTKTLEYFACEKPVLATRLPFHEDLVGRSLGVLIDDNPQAVEQGILELVRLEREGKLKVPRSVIADRTWSALVRQRLLPIYES
uniref:Glycosyltransferase n=1 Tax=candidate division WWE3 bacterium TaxID=2053526 RepID=A0A832DUR0_UNCKA